MDNGVCPFMVVAFDGLVKGDVLRFKEDLTLVCILKKKGPDLYLGWQPGMNTGTWLAVHREDWERTDFLGNFRDELQTFRTLADQQKFVEQHGGVLAIG